MVDGVSPGRIWDLFIYSSHTCYISPVGGWGRRTAVRSRNFKHQWNELGRYFKIERGSWLPISAPCDRSDFFSVQKFFHFFFLVKYLLKKWLELITWDKWVNKTCVLDCTCLFTRIMLTIRGICGIQVTHSALSWIWLRWAHLNLSLLPLDFCFSPNKALFPELTEVK